MGGCCRYFDHDTRNPTLANFDSTIIRHFTPLKGIQA